MIEKSFAKVNLFLEVVGKRPDGYHELETVFHEIDLFDTIELNVSPSKDSQKIEVECKKLNILPEENIVYKACKAFFSKFDIKDSVFIKIEKNIPSGAGLGGGSSNAACVLKMLAKIYNIKNYFEELHPIATRLGADVPFFLKGGTAIGRGIGEKLEFIFLNKKFYFVLLFPDVHVPTKDVYKALTIDLTKKIDCDKFLSALSKGDLEEIGSLLFNKLEETTFSLYPSLKTYKESLSKDSKFGCLMSGSGSTFYTFALNKSQAEDMQIKFVKNGYNAWVSCSVG